MLNHLHSATAAAVAGMSLSLHDWLVALKQRGRLQALLREAVVEHFLLRQAGIAGLAVSDGDLQAAADAFRRRHGLTSAEQAHAWLAQQHLSISDLEAALERDLLVEKLKDHLTRDRIANHFAARQSDYARAQMRQIVVDREELARELLCQVHDDHQAFADLARRHSRHPSRADGGNLGTVFRAELPPAVSEAVFTARAGEIIGPVASPQGFLLFQIEALHPAGLDEQTAARIREELFAAWLNEQLRNTPPDFPLLDLLR